MHEIGFNSISVNHNSDLLDKISKIINFKDVSKKDIIKQLEKYEDFTDVDVKSLLKEIDYINCGYTKLESTVKKYLLNCK